LQPDEVFDLSTSFAWGKETQCDLGLSQMAMGFLPVSALERGKDAHYLTDLFKTNGEPAREFI
jgi:hypothetical protein